VSTQLDLAAADINGVGQENVGSGQINFHCRLTTNRAGFSQMPATVLIVRPT
jgi:hypothetical protein